MRYSAETDFDQSGSGIWHLRVAEGDHLSERSEGGKLPQHKTRALATLGKLKTLLRGCFEGMQGGKRGAAPMECWERQHDWKSGVGRGFAAP